MVTTSNCVGSRLVVVHGRRGAVLEWVRRSAADDEERFELDTSPSAFPVPWRAARGLLRELARRRGLAAVEDAAAPHRLHLGTILRPLQARLTPEEARRRAADSGARLARLPGANSITVGLMADAVVGTVTALLGRGPVGLVIASAAELDSESWGVLSPLLQRHAALTLYVGQEPGYVPRSPIQARVAEVGAWELSVLESLRHVETRRIELGAADPTPASEPAGGTTAGEGFPLDDELEARAAELLAREGAATEDVARTAMAAIHAAFDALGFPAVLWLAQRLLARADALAPKVEAEARLLAGVSAHNLCAFARRAPAEHPLQAYGDEQLDRALPRLSAEDRAFVLYRRGLRLASSREGLAAAEELLATAVDVARTLPERCVLHRVYAHNGLAFVKYRVGQRAAAREHCQAALRAAEASHPDAPEVEVGSACFNVLVNLGRLSFLDGDLDAARERLLQAMRRLDAIPYRKPFFSWFSTQVFLDDMGAAVDELERRLAVLEPCWAETMIAGYSFWAADLHYRLGDATRAYERFGLAVELWSHFHEDPSDVFFVGLNCAVAAYRDGRLEDARRRFSTARAALADDAHELRAEIDGALALVAARDGDRDGAHAAIGSALRALEDVGDVEVRARVLRVIGDVHVALGELDAAGAAFRSGLEHAAASAGGAGELDASTLPPEDLLGLLLGAVELGADRPELVRAAFELAPRALLEPGAWWDMPRLVRLLEEPRWRQAAEQSGTDLGRLLSLVRQRPDCAELVDALEAPGSSR